MYIFINLYLYFFTCTFFFQLITNYLLLKRVITLKLTNSKFQFIIYINYFSWVNYFVLYSIVVINKTNSQLYKHIAFKTFVCVLKWNSNSFLNRYGPFIMLLFLPTSHVLKAYYGISLKGPCLVFGVNFGDIDRCTTWTSLGRECFMSPRRVIPAKPLEKRE